MSKCKNCGRTFLVGDYIIYNALGCYCADRKNCFNRRKNMVVTKSLKITAEIDGKQVPLNNISIETFEAIKALEKPKEIPVARLVTCSGEPRLLFKPTCDINFRTGTIYALNLKNGILACSWAPNQDKRIVESQYKEIVTI